MKTGVIVGIVVLAVVVGVNVVMRRMGYAIPGRPAVRCSKGHLFRTTWIEGGSLKAIRLGPVRRVQRCPVGQHWTLVRPVKEKDLTDEDRRALDEAASR